MRADLSTIQQTLTLEAAAALARAIDEAADSAGAGAGALAARTRHQEVRPPGILSPAALPPVASTRLRREGKIESKGQTCEKSYREKDQEQISRGRASAKKKSNQ
jgi:hypothetical protein